MSTQLNTPTLQLQAIPIGTRIATRGPIMKITELEQNIVSVEQRAVHTAALLNALGNPSEWTFTGEVVDAKGSEAECACGHPIRYCYIISHPTRSQTHVGSTCIDHIASISPELGDTLIAARTKLEAELRAAEAKARRAAADRENADRWMEYATLRDQARAAHRDNRSRGVRSPRDLWYFCEGWDEKYNSTTIPPYTRAADLAKWIKRAIDRARSVIAAN